ncbi:MAG: LamG-like jellyroll fold domain-containing protein [Pirellulales bacterium]
MKYQRRTPLGRNSWMANRILTWILAWILSWGLFASGVGAADLARWTAAPEKSPPPQVHAGQAIFESGDWSYLTSPDEWGDVEVTATTTIEKPATQFDFFGSSWSAWPNAKFEDRGFEGAIVVRWSDDGRQGYRVQWSAKYQEIALVRFPDGGYVRSVKCPITTQRPTTVRVTAAGSVIRVAVDGEPRIHYVDRLEPLLAKGRVAIGASSGARTTFTAVDVRSIPAEATSAATPHTPRLSFRPWLGGRLFVFDDEEPILQLQCEQDPSMFAKLRPGLKPLMTFDSHWGLENQGAYKEAAVKWTAPTASGGGESLRATWSANHVQGRFRTHSELVVGYDARRDVYTYDIDSRLEMLPGEPFYFRYGFDFEHHTPLDPFRWQYLLIRDRQGRLTYRPLSPFDPGPLDDIEAYNGLRVWHGRTGDLQRVSPAVEYRIQPEANLVVDAQGKPTPRKLGTAVCAAFYDTGVSFEPSLGKPGDKVHVRYRYTGYPAEETATLFATARVQENPRIDPHHHFLFARDQWPVIRFSDVLPLDQPWWGGRPFLTGHNARPSYGFVRQGEQGVMRLGPASYAIAPVGPERAAPGRYLVTVRVKSINTHGPGGRIELLSLKKSDPHGNGYVRLDAGNILHEEVRYFGAGTFDWRESSFVAEMPANASGLALGLGNAGTGEVWVSQVQFEPWGDKPAPSQVLSATPPETKPRDGALWDLRMEERSGLFVYNYGSSPHRSLELANLDWVEDEGRSALRFGENPTTRADFPALGILDQNLRNPVYGAQYVPVRHGAYGLGGYHGGGERLAGLTLAAWIKPATEMGKGHHQGKGDVIGYGARRFILGLQGQTAPYSLVARINVNDRVESKVELTADQWRHAALTCEPSDGQWLVRLYLDAVVVGEGRTTKFPADSLVPDSLILGAELFYLHDAYYRGLLSDVVVAGRAMRAEEIQALMGRTTRP